MSFTYRKQTNAAIESWAGLHNELVRHPYEANTHSSQDLEEWVFASSCIHWQDTAALGDQAGILWKTWIQTVNQKQKQQQQKTD